MVLKKALLRPVAQISEVGNVCVLVNVYSLSESGRVKQYPFAVDSTPS